MSYETFDYLYDTTEDTTTRFVSFVGEAVKRFDLAITSTGRFYGKKLVTDLQLGRTAILGPDDLEEPGYLARLFELTEEEEQELLAFLTPIIGTVNFTDL
ncbi:hypothetical protein J31TS4_20290 [Paenibacillus sp. J31TS4]|uniref:DUF3055 domain-containing protein n=1 Tax=Paenibacillus sp. J31TS4 TaxID=2807195 RepID=UPI001B217C44|nr:DUF3055 domain-containing protein [Paenibacillus sp. J31TS4]GIP38749.1 hypothetical protein J31TS4_20290 [Paenibacillus sp. J31TS4]